MAEVLQPRHAPIPTPKVKPIISDQLRPSSSTTPKPIFDPAKHLSYKEDPKVLTLNDIGIDNNDGISPVAVSDPFPLFSEEAIKIMRSEIFTNEVWENCMFSSEFAGCQLRGHCPKYAPFMHTSWTHPATLSTISRIAGIDLVPIFDYEIGNINISVNDPIADSTKRSADQSEDELPVTKWHHDSYPFVCVVMMSDARGMVGGETALRRGDGRIEKVRGPQMGSAVILQGHIIMHQALSARGASERITMITSFRARDPFVKDTSVLTNIRPISDKSEMYYQWTRYRMEVLIKKLEGMKEVLDGEHNENEGTDVERVKVFLKEQEGWVQGTWREIEP
ncbi:hypothetical protein BDV96DRAFT_504784 [Lophiotrema nucula]|uniref:Fe2OG dioxygenase domain-containing protein n=1 Tax=Lophiotrema nucula TaxID=690887 RepID=A0A6A5YLG0_9PLEO|nr:hypothetical protein BDV96DRAFT_504784 [Lophiotrema nucula]